jgi:hypothetical protein
MTEQEALTKWCPFSRVRAGNSLQEPAVNKNANGWVVPGSGCIGSSCMAWRAMNAQVSYGTIERHGYCGLAGVPV